jgi:hypothetical protein
MQVDARIVLARKYVTVTITGGCHCDGMNNRPFRLYGNKSYYDYWKKPWFCERDFPFFWVL